MTKDEAIKWAGTQVKLAEALGMRSQGTIAGWREYPPELRQLQIEALSGGLLKAEPECDKFRVPTPAAAMLPQEAPDATKAAA